MPLSKVVQDSLNGGVAGTGPAFYAGTNYNITVSNATYTAATTYSSVSFDTASAFNSSTGRFTPQVAGYYQINAIADFGSNGQGAASSISCLIFKNGSVLTGAGASSSGTSYAGYGCSAIIYLNGSTDYLQAGIYQNSGGTTSSARVIFNGVMVRAA